MTASLPGILNELLRDDSISEIMINGLSPVFVERNARLESAGKFFSSETELYALIDAILEPLEKRVNRDLPLADARLPDGSRVNIIIPPLSLSGPMITIRKFRKQKLDAAALIANGSCSPGMLQFMELCVQCRQNIIISGGTGSGKTTVLTLLASFIPGNERIITIEDTAELQLSLRNMGRLEARPAGSDGTGAFPVQQLLHNALRMRPDRIIIGECRGGETLAMLQAMNTGHEGSFSTVHANSSRECLKRLEIMALMSGMDIPIPVIREQIASSINILIHTARLADGTRKITEIAEVTEMEGDTVTLAPLFRFHRNLNDTGQPGFAATRILPRFVEKAAADGMTVEREMFR
jgi:pilus assembly protein CpaF